MSLTLRDANTLFHQAGQMLAEIEHYGVRVDRTYLVQQMNETRIKIQLAIEELRKTPEFERWQEIYGLGTNIHSRSQLAKILFKVLGYSPLERNKSGKGWKADERVLMEIDTDFTRKYLAMEKQMKLQGTYFEGVLREVRNDRVHPVYTLNNIDSYRTGCNSPNWQNVPKRNPAIAQLARRIYIPRPGFQIVEIDYSRLEVFIAAEYHRDPVMIKYLLDDSTCMHRDTARQLFRLESNAQVSKDARYVAKNAFVFAQFYGSVYTNCAANIWKMIQSMNLKIEGTDTSIYEHLRQQGITERGICDLEKCDNPEPHTYEYVVKQVQDSFWNERFTKYADWKKRWWDRYLETGMFQMKTGFICKADLKKNQVLNYAVQGCLQGHAKILTREQGWVEIAQLEESKDIVEVWTGFNWANAIAISKGQYTYAKIELESGLIIHCDTRHKLKGIQNEWIEFKHLGVGTQVALPRTIDALEPSFNMTWEFLLGFIIGDGYLNENREELTLSGGERKYEEIRKIEKYLNSLDLFADKNCGQVRCFIVQRKSGRKPLMKLRLDNKEFALRLKEAGIDFTWRAKTKRIPATIWSGSPQQQRDFLQGLWRSDGARAKHSLYNLHMCNKELLQEVQVLASGVGFDSFLVKTKSGWKVSFSWRGVNAKSPRLYPVKAITTQVEKVQSLNYSDRNQAVTDERCLRNAYEGKAPTQYVGERIIEKSGGSDKEIYRFDRIKKIEILKKQGPTYTMSVYDPIHQFVADGVITKNSAAHCTLQSMLYIREQLRRQKMRSRLIGEIHDAIVAEVHPNELEHYVKLSTHIMTKYLAQQWSWLTLPLKVEVEAAQVDEAWSEKKVLHF